MAKIAYASDLHLEVLYDSKEAAQVLHDILTVNHNNCDAFVLAGDIIEARLLAASKESSKYEYRTLAIELFEGIATAYPQVFYIMGNHEHYHGTFEKSCDIIRNATGHIENFTVLENETATIKDVAVFGATFWTDAGGPANEWKIQQGMNDYRLITSSSPSYRKLRVSDTVKAHTRSLTILREFLRQNTAKKVAVFTHHAPHIGMIDAYYRTYASSTNAAYYTDQSELMLDHDELLLWISGHTHSVTTDHIGNTTTASSALGYFGHEIAMSDLRNYKPGVIEI
jgi:predicted phosphodiesterase